MSRRRCTENDRGPGDPAFPAAAEERVLGLPFFG